MTTPIQLPKPRKLWQFIFWMFLCIVLPSLPFVLVWVIKKYIVSESATMAEIVAKPDLLFIGFIAATTTLADLVDTVDTFKRSVTFLLVFLVIFLAIIWSSMLYSILVVIFELPQQFTRTTEQFWFIVVNATLVVIVSTICQLFLFTYRKEGAKK